ncbi:hypothetical protein [Seleniivibrio woodruffii]|uniref:Phage terminase small subunit n=1 Tax=Seleniivibrio woodruffii TaxID=1078050 RepID=A0A4R1K756_9BACT|nr:hypothetical protein [Seleniivibrio woodruffii]TCK59850.1 hypothetical protein C8D98_2017 [Seleniivibrio woodruffii]TVZ35929.1 hypothetical protein OF66_1549 [Seleniivibrio woodruffii]
MARPTAEKWKQLRQDYEDGLYDLSELAEHYGVDFDSVRRQSSAQRWKRPETDRTVRRLKAHRVQMLQAICTSTMEGLKKADDLLAECDSLRDVELHSKTVKNYRDICLGKVTEEMFDSSKRSALIEFQAELENLSEADVDEVFDNA